MSATPLNEPAAPGAAPGAPPRSPSPKGGRGRRPWRRRLRAIGASVPPIVVDLLITLAVAAISSAIALNSLISLKTPADAPTTQPWLPFSIAVALLCCLCLFLRRRAPRVAWAAVTLILPLHHAALLTIWAADIRATTAMGIVACFYLPAASIILGTIAARNPPRHGCGAALVTTLTAILSQIWFEAAQARTDPVHALSSWAITRNSFVLALINLCGLVVGLTIHAQRERLSRELDRARRIALEREQVSLLAVSAERSRIAREMHDVVAHSLAVMVTMADGAAAALDRDPEMARKAITALAEAGRSALADTRRLVGVLREDPQVGALATRATGGPGDSTDIDGKRIKDLPVPEFAPPGTVAPREPTTAVADLRRAAAAHADGAGGDAVPMRPAPEQADLQILVDRFASAGIPITYSWRGRDLPEDRGLQMTLFRLAQESLTNVLRYAPTTSRVSVDVERHIGTAVLTVDNEAAPGTTPMHGSGKGLIGMRERAAVYGGNVQAGPHASGWRVRAVLRWDEEDQEGSTPWQMPM
ncbi:histidine kinase [Actinomyces timonensis]|uniref:histidine kinase n=1 Tax=Actinomyces timonensis TaxID=1288391 RepID=A0AAU8N3W5_9ACTO